MAHQLHCNAIEPSKRSHTPPLDASTGSTSPPLPVLRRHPTCRTRDRQLRSTSETSRRLSTHTGKSPDSPGGGHPARSLVGCDIPGFAAIFEKPRTVSSENAVVGSCAGFLRRIGGTPSQAGCTRTISLRSLVRTADGDISIVNSVGVGAVVRPGPCHHRRLVRRRPRSCCRRRPKTVRRLRSLRGGPTD